MKPIRKKQIDGERLLAQETLILEATERIVALLQDQHVSRQELAERLGRSKGHVSQLLAGDRNMTLRTLADLGYALGQTFRMSPEPLELVGVEPQAFEPRSADEPLPDEEIPPEPMAAEPLAAEPVETVETAVDSHEYALAA